MTEETDKKEPLDAMTPYSEIKAEIATAKEKNAAMAFDYESTAGNKQARSHVNGLRHVKSAIEKVRKATKADALAFGKKVDSIAKELTGEVEGMIGVHTGPLDAIQAKEEKRIRGHELNLAEFEVTEYQIRTLASEQIESTLNGLKAIEVDKTWEEYEERGHKAKMEALAKVESILAESKKNDAEQAELKKHREAEEQRKKDADELEQHRKEKAEREEKAERDRIQRHRNNLETLQVTAVLATTVQGIKAEIARIRDYATDPQFFEEFQEQATATRLESLESLADKLEMAEADADAKPTAEEPEPKVEEVEAEDPAEAPEPREPRELRRVRVPERTPADILSRLLDEAASVIEIPHYYESEEQRKEIVAELREAAKTVRETGGQLVG